MRNAGEHGSSHSTRSQYPPRSRSNPRPPRKSLLGLLLMGSNEHAWPGPSHPETNCRNQMAEECEADRYAQKGRRSYRADLENQGEKECAASNPHVNTPADMRDPSVPPKKVAREEKRDSEAQSRSRSSVVRFAHPDAPSAVMPGCCSTRQETKKRTKSRFARFRDRLVEFTARPVHSDMSSAMELAHAEELPGHECFSHFHPTRTRPRAMTMVR